MGYHIGQLFKHMFMEDKHRNDFMEMMLHHSATVYLFGFSYINNFLLGGPCTFLHNWADIAISWTRFWNETKYYKSISLISFIFSMVIWAYTRLYVFAKLIAAFVAIEVFTYSPYVIPILGFLLCSLYVLHVYWFILMLKIVYNSVFGGKYEDAVT